MDPLAVVVWVLVAYAVVAGLVALTGLYLAWNELEPADRYRHYRLAMRAPVWPVDLVGGLGRVREDYQRSKAAAAEADRRSLVERLDQLEVELDRQAALNEQAAAAWQRLQQRHDERDGQD